MAQNPLSAFVAKIFGGTALKPLVVDASGALIIGNAGLTSFNLTAAAVIKATPGRLVRIVIQDAGTTGGSFTFNDCATVGAAAVGNQLFTVAFNGTGVVPGGIFTLDIPCATGIVLSAVPTGGTPRVAVTYL